MKRTILIAANYRDGQQYLGDHLELDRREVIVVTPGNAARLRGYDIDRVISTDFAPSQPGYSGLLEVADMQRVLSEARHAGV